MKNEDTFNLHLAFLAHTALVIGFLLTVSSVYVTHQPKAPALVQASTTLDSGLALSQKK